MEMDAAQTIVDSAQACLRLATAKKDGTGITLSATEVTTLVTLLQLLAQGVIDEA